MKTMFLAFAACAVIALGADVALDEIGFSAADRTSAPDSVRLGDAGEDRRALH